jgi:hypothetical protein
MVLLPPADTETSDEISDDDTDRPIDDWIVRYSIVTCVVGGEYELMPH